LTIDKIKAMPAALVAFPFSVLLQYSFTNSNLPSFALRSKDSPLC
jgi:hypothetical protein